MNTNNNNNCIYSKHNNNKRSERSVVFTAFWPEENQQTAEKTHLVLFFVSLRLKSYAQFFRSFLSLSVFLLHAYFCYFYKSLALIYRLEWLKTHMVRLHS